MKKLTLDVMSGHLKVAGVFKKYFLILLLCFVLSIYACTNFGSKREQKPNIIIILTDDQGYGDVGYNGNSQITTPVLDSLSEVGIRFNNFYASPVSAPTRASLLTGRYHYRTGTHWVSNGKENMDPEEYTLAELLQDNGYKTGAFGKWHNGAHYPFHPNRQGFEKFVGFCMGHWNNYFNTTIEENGEPVLANGYLPDYLTGRAIEFIKENKDNPFFCYIPYNTPHSPFQVPDKYFDKYKARGLDDKTACIYGMCENIDDNVGNILKNLDSLNLTEETIIIYMSDNGPVPGRYNAGLRGTKGHIHEGGVKVPAVWIIPEKYVEDQKSTVDQIAAHIDVMPTLVELLDLNLHQEVDFDGLSLVNSIMGKSDEKIQHRMLFQKAPQRNPEIWGGAIRTGDYRILLKGQDTLLYHLVNDPSETVNLKDSLPYLADSLSKAYFSWIQKTMDEMPKFTSIPVGVDGQTNIHLPAHEAMITGYISFKEGHGWANDWIINITNPFDSLYWEIKSMSRNRYKVSVLYNASTKSEGLELMFSSSNASLIWPIDVFYKGNMVPSPDRHVRKEVYEKTWGKLKLGEIELSENDTFVSLKIISGNNLVNNNDLEIKALILEKI